MRHSFNEVINTLIPKSDILRKENFRPISFMNTDTKIINLILVSEFSNIWRGLQIMTKWVLS